MVFTTMDGRLKSHLTFSVFLHGTLIAALFLVLPRLGRAPQEIYTIDFIGPTSGILNREMETSVGASAGRTAAGKTQPENHPNEFATRSKHRPLPRPSILSGLEPETPAKPSAVPTEPEASESASKPAGSASGSGSAPADATVAADMPNFPYPWYIAQVRGALWTQWSSRMPGGGGEVMIEFSIMRDGALTDLRVESSSGGGGFDHAAITAAQAAAAFPPLPRGFAEKFLHIHVRFTSQ